MPLSYSGGHFAYCFLMSIVRIIIRSKPFFHYCSMPFEDALLYEDDKQLGTILNFVAVALMFVPNGQIARTLGLSLNNVNAMFPLSAKV